MKTKVIKGSLTISYTEDGAVPSVTFLSEKKGEVGVVVTGSPSESILGNDKNIAVMTNPVVTITNKNSL